MCQAMVIMIVKVPTHRFYILVEWIEKHINNKINNIFPIVLSALRKIKENRLENNWDEGLIILTVHSGKASLKK